MIKNVIFDMGNVLFRYNPEIPLNEFTEDEEGKNYIRNELFRGPEWIERDRGVITVEEQIESVKKRIPEKYYESLKRCAYEWTICMKPIEGSREFFDEVRNKGYKVYLLSNACDNIFTYFERFAPIEMFDGMLVSYQIKKIKPEHEIYVYLLNKYGLAADECIFIDDLESNTQAAKDVGMKAVTFTGDWDIVRRALYTDI